MPKKNSNSPATTESEKKGADATITAGDELLKRAKAVAKQIEEKVRRLTDDTKPELSALPSDSTDEKPALL